VYGATEEQINAEFVVQANGKLVVDVDFGAIEVNTNGGAQVTVDVFRSVSRSSKADEEAFLAEHPVKFSQDGNIITVSSRSKTNMKNWWHGNQRTEGKYTISVPGAFGAQLRTAGGAITVNDLTGGVKATTSGGGLRFARLHGTLNGETSGGSIRIASCEGELKVKTSGGGIDVAGGSGSLDGITSGGNVNVRDFRGATHVGSSGGGLTLEN